MATGNFSVPEMRRAVKEKRRALSRAAAIDKLLDLRRQQRPVSAAKIARTRQADRP